MFTTFLIIEISAIIITTRYRLNEIFLYSTFRLNTKQNEAEEIKLKIKSSLVKITIDFIHILTLTTEFNFHWPDIVRVLFLTNFLNL